MPEKPKSYFESEVDRLYTEELFRAELYVQVRRSKALMENYYSERIEVNELAKTALMSRFHYIRTFQSMYGLTPRSYLRDLRIKQAKNLLRSGLSVTEVCFAVGYESLPTFSSVFKKCTGYTPRDYQWLHKSNRE
ncbi:helix-turn-helix domain-containing protein [Vreelandella venusta]|uniref:helix-turn-helix domain-containing protein n=1 Tax=Vreelandella venusta TaxID=44935 RepID=UPI003BF52CBE